MTNEPLLCSVKKHKRMNYFSSNIKLLRKRIGFTQEELASALDMKRSTLSGYENQVAEPSMEVLLSFSNFFKTAIDTLVRVDLTAMHESQLSQLERGYDVYINGSKLRVLATSVGSDGIENIEMVSEKAKAGYSGGYADPEYISILPTFRLPFLSKERKYRSFQVSGDSMHPIPDGAYVTGEYVQNWQSLKNKEACIIVTLNDGVVFKIAENKIKDKGLLVLHSLNNLYKPYEVPVSEIKEIWKFVNFISNDLPEPNRERENLFSSIEKLKKEVKAIQTKLDI
jgi:transcriptional regulator with XRE-family HTH domain